MPTFSKRQRRRQRRRSRQKCHKNLRPQSCHYWKMYRDRHRKRPVCAQTIYAYAPSQKCRSTCQPRHHRSRGGVLLFSKRQKIPQKHLFGSHYPNVRLYPIHRQPKKCHACARMMCAHARTRKSRIIPPRQQHKSKDGVHMCGSQRNHAQKIALRVIIFIQSHQKFAFRKIFPCMSRRASVKSQQSRSCAANCHPKQRQRKRRTFGISSKPVHGRRVLLNPLPCAAKNCLSENA